MNAEGARRTPTIVTGVVVALAIIVYGGYGQHWSWIGINGHTATLWDWLHLLLLPIAAVLLPLWLRHRTTMERRMVAGAAGLVGVFAVIVIAGYTIPWAWTGFTGNSLWDWLNLAALPLAVALIPVFVELRGELGRRHAVAGFVGAVVFLGLVLAGYLAKWRWTGFTGNTVWDWIHLVLLPMLVPLAIVPMLRPMALARLGVEADPPPAPEPPAAPEPPLGPAPPAAPQPNAT